MFMTSSCGQIESEENLIISIKRLITAAKKLNKLIVATGDVHAREDFLDEDEIALFLKAGLDINTWGVKNRFRYAYFKEKGVNIVIANKNFKKLKM